MASPSSFLKLPNEAMMLQFEMSPFMLRCFLLPNLRNVVWHTPFCQHSGQTSAHMRTLSWVSSVFSGCQNQDFSHELQTIAQASKSWCLKSLTILVKSKTKFFYAYFVRLVFSYIFIWNFARETGKLARSRLELIPSRTPNVSPLCSSRHTLWCLVGHNWHSNYTTFSNNLDHQHFWKQRKCEKKCYV